MRKLIAITQLTTDGVMQGPGGPEEDPRSGFTHGGWAMEYGDEVLLKELNDTISGSFDLLLGHWTYQLWSGFWPKQTGNPIGIAFDKATKFVATRGTGPLSWGPAKRIGGEADVRALKKTDGPELHAWGSSVLLQSLIAANLVDEYRLWIAPVVLGTGKRLFEHGVPVQKLSLITSIRTPRGVLMNTYRPT